MSHHHDFEILQSDHIIPHLLLQTENKAFEQTSVTSQHAQSSVKSKMALDPAELFPDGLCFLELNSVISYRST